MNGALALRPSTLPSSIAQSIGELPFGSQAQVQVADGKLAAFFAFAGYDERLGTVKYALRILNNTTHAARARIYVDARGTQIAAYPLDFEVAPLSLRDDIVPVRMDVTGPYDRAIVEVSSPQTCFTVEAPPPPRRSVPWAKWGAAAAIPLIFAGATQLAMPRVLGVTAPAKALAGTTVAIPYQISGVGTVEYDVTARDGMQLVAGLGNASGVLRVPIPARGAAPYTVNVRMRNAFASASASATIGVVAPPVPKVRKPEPDAGALIGDLSVSPSPARAGSRVVVAYATQGQTGSVFLVDMAGRTWARAPLSPIGRAAIGVPQAAAGRDMRVVLYAQRGKQHAQSAVALTVLPSNDAAKPVAPQAPPAQAASQSAEVTLSSQVVSAGDSVTVRVHGIRGDVRVTLMSAGGTTVEQGDASEGDGGVSISAPTVSGVTTYYVVATFSSGVSQQSIVRRLVVTPR